MPKQSLSSDSLRTHFKNLDKKTLADLKRYANPRTSEAQKHRIEKALGIQKRGTYTIIEQVGIVIDTTGNCFILVQNQPAILVFKDEKDEFTWIDYEQQTPNQEPTKIPSVYSKQASNAQRKLGGAGG